MNWIAPISKVLALIIILVLFMGALPWAYSYHLSPLARLRANIEIQDSYVDAEKLFVDFYEGRKADEVFEFAHGTTASHLMRGEMPLTKHLFLYHDSIFDNIQLQVLFDENDKVKEILFIGD